MFYGKCLILIPAGTAAVTTVQYSFLLIAYICHQARLVWANTRNYIVT